MTFTNTTSGEVTGYAWAFGDGATCVITHPTHVYTGTGVYTVSLTAAEPGGSDTLTRTNYIAVTGGYTTTTRAITYTYDSLNRLTGSAYSTGESFEYAYDAVGNRTAYTATTPLSGTLVTTYIFDAARRLTDRAVSDGRTYTYTWSARGQFVNFRPSWGQWFSAKMGHSER